MFKSYQEKGKSATGKRGNTLLRQNSELQIMISKRHLNKKKFVAAKKIEESLQRIPCDFMLQEGNAGHIKHDTKEKQRFAGKLVQLLFQRFLQFHPSHLLALVVKPKAKIVCLEEKKSLKTNKKVIIWSHLQTIKVSLFFSFSFIFPPEHAF